MAPSKSSSNGKKVTKKPNNVTKQQQQRSAPRKRGKTERKQRQDAVSNWHSQYKNQINPSTGVNWTLTELVVSPTLWLSVVAGGGDKLSLLLFIIDDI